jgi:ankyrin repeat protein
MYYQGLSLLFILMTLVGGCKSTESYKRELEQRGTAYSVENFFNEVRAKKKEDIELFIRAGMDVNVKDAAGTPALMFAFAKHNVEIMKLLIENGAEVNAKDTVGMTGLMIASAKGNIEVAALLIEKGAGVNEKRNDGITALRFALANGSNDVAELLRRSGARE